MNIERVKKLPVQDRYLYWITEREKIRHARDRGEPKPWTDDEILQKYKFCNVRRMDDRVSKWLLFNWYKKHFGHRNMLTAVTVARHFNTIDTFRLVKFPIIWDPHKMARKVNISHKKGNKVFSAAYMITGKANKTKADYAIFDVANKVFKRQTEIMNGIQSMEELVDRLITIKGISHFLGGQIAADMRWATPGMWRDKKTWAAKGPGSQRGLNRLLERPINTTFKDHEFQIELQKVIGLCVRNLPAIINHRLEAIDYQNTLCEFFKYERTLFPGIHSSSRPKQTYPGVE